MRRLHISRRTQLAFLVVLACTVRVADLAAVPNPYEFADSSLVTHAYRWDYPVVMALLGLLFVVVVSLRQPKARLIGYVFIVVLLIPSTLLLFIGNVYASPAHIALLRIMLVACPVVLFLSGVAFAAWRAQNASREN